MQRAVLLPTACEAGSMLRAVLVPTAYEAGSMQRAVLVLTAYEAGSTQRAVRVPTACEASSMQRAVLVSTACEAGSMLRAVLVPTAYEAGSMQRVVLVLTACEAGSMQRAVLVPTAWEAGSMQRAVRVPIQHLVQNAMKTRNTFFELADWSINLKNNKRVLICLLLPDVRKSLLRFKVPRLRPLVLLIRVVFRRRLVWSIGEMIMECQNRPTPVKPLPVPFGAPKNPHEPARERT